MSSMLIAVLAIIALFVVLLAVKAVSKKEFCVLCASVSMTWLGLLVLQYRGAFNDSVLIALLIGESITGAYYALARRVSNHLYVFKLPALLTLTVAGYALVLPSPALLAALPAVGSIWAVAAGIYYYQHHPAVRSVAAKLVACCRDW